MMTNNLKLSDVCSDCFILILHLRATKEFGDAEVLRRRVKDLLNVVENKAHRINISTDDIENTIFALVAFIDETISTSEWSQKSVWMSNRLAHEKYVRTDAGEEFFRKLHQLIQKPRENAQVLEIYYLCLSLGFKGKYQRDEQQKLLQLINDLYNKLKRIADKPLDVLSPHGRPKEEFTEAIGKIPTWIIGVVAASIGIIFYIIMSLIISNNANKVSNSLG